MNRQQRRQRDREIEKEMSVLKKLPPKDLMKVSEMVEKLTKSKTDEAIHIIDRSMCGVLVDEGWTLKEIERMQDKMTEFMIEDQEKIKILLKENVDMAKLETEVKEYMKGLIQSGKVRKEVIEETMFKFPKLSKTATNNAYGRILDEIETEKAAAYILEDNKELKKKVKKAENKEEKPKAEPKVEEVKEEPKADELEVLEEEIIKSIKVKGKNGVYNAKTNEGISLDTGDYKINFKTKEDFKIFVEEINRVFERI